MDAWHLVLFAAAVWACAAFSGAYVVARIRRDILFRLPRHEWTTVQACERLGISGYWSRLCVIGLFREQTDIEIRDSATLQPLTLADERSSHSLTVASIDRYEFCLSGIADSRGALRFICSLPSMPSQQSIG